MCVYSIEFIGAVAAIVATLLGPSAHADDFDDCLNASSASRGIDACEDALNSANLSSGERARVYSMLGFHQRRDGALDSALVSFEQSLDLAPSDPRVLSEAALVHQMLGDSARSISIYTRVLDISPSDARARNNRAVALMNRGNHADALRDLDFAISLDPENANAWNNRANAHCAAGNWDAAYADRIQALYHGRFSAGAAQSGMRKTGYYSGPADGIWGYDSENALREWTRAGCPQAPKSRLN